MNADRNHILVIGAEQGIARMLRLTLRDEGFDVEFADAGDGASAAANGVDVLVFDLQPSFSEGLDTVANPLAYGYSLPVIVLSGEDAQQVRLQTGADAALQKPFDGEQLARVIRSVLRRRYR